MDENTQQELLSELGGIDGTLSSIKIHQEKLELEKEALLLKRAEILQSCKHTDEDGKPTYDFGYLYKWCAICGCYIDD